MRDTLKITIDSENINFQKKVELLSGQNILSCYQCGECSGSCPTAHEMDLLPSTIMRLLQIGQKEVLESNSIWLCNSCQTCYVRCPREIDITKIMEALRQINLRKNVSRVNPREISDEDLDEIPQIALIGCFRRSTS